MNSGLVCRKACTTSFHQQKVVVFPKIDAYELVLSFPHKSRS